MEEVAVRGRWRRRKIVKKDIGVRDIVTESIGCTHYVLFLFLGLGFKKSVFLFIYFF